MVFPAAVLVPVLWSAGTAAVTGIASYFMFHNKNAPVSESAPKIDTRGEIHNNVHLAVKENNSQNETLVLLMSALVIIKIIEVVIYAINTVKNNMKKKYIKKYEQRERPAAAMNV